VVDNDVLEHVNVQRDVEGAGSDRCNLAEEDVLRHPMTIVSLADCCRLHKDLDRLLEGRAHERAGVRAVDSMPSDRHERATMGHQVAEKSQVSVIDVGAVELDDIAELAHNGGACSLDTEDIEDFDA